MTSTDNPVIRRVAELDQHPGRAYAVGQEVEYQSFDPSGWTAGRVLGYADDAEQDDPHNPRLCILTASGSKTPTRESQIRPRTGTAEQEPA